MTDRADLVAIRARAEYWRTREIGIRCELRRCLTSLGEHDLDLEDITEGMLARWMSVSCLAIRAAGATVLAERYATTLQHTFAAAQELKRCNEAGHVNQHATHALAVAMDEFAVVNAEVSALLDGKRHRACP
jgi:hypothetical protein